jgi:hypothetical protein
MPEYNLNRLFEPFGLDQIEQHSYHKYFYLKEEAINHRLTEVFGDDWGFELVGEPRIFKAGEFGELMGKDKVVKEDIAMVQVHGRLITAGQHFDGIGASELVSLGGKFNEQLMNTIKAADTDAFKRVARKRGVGLFLTELSTSDVKIDSFDKLRVWLHGRYPADARFLSDWSRIPFKDAVAEMTGLLQPYGYPDFDMVKLAVKSMGLTVTVDNIYEIYETLKSHPPQQ